MIRYITLLALLLLNSVPASAHLPYLDLKNTHNSYASAFEFKDNIYSRALCTTTTCPPRYYHYNGTAHSNSTRYHSVYTWSKVYVGAGENLHFEFGVPYLPSLEYPPFRPTIYLLGEGLPSCDAFDYPKPQYLEYSIFKLPYGYFPQTLRFNLADPGYQPKVVYESHLEARFSVYLNYTIPVTCAGDVYIVVESREKRIVEYYTAVGETEGVPPGGPGAGVATIEEAKHWAQGLDSRVGTYCKRRGYYERD